MTYGPRLCAGCQGHRAAIVHANSATWTRRACPAYSLVTVVLRTSVFDVLQRATVLILLACIV